LNTVKIGDVAENFKIDDQDYKPVSLSSFKGKKVLLSFHPLAWTKTCSLQMSSLEKNWERFEAFSTVPLGISVDSSPCKLAWAKSLDIKKTRLLADFWPHGAVSQMYGLFDEKEGTSKRANVLVDENCKIAFVKVYPIGQVPDIDEVICCLKPPKEGKKL